MHTSGDRGGAIGLLRDWWERQRGSRAAPCRSEFDPAALRRILPDLIVIDVAAGDRPNSHRFTYRLAGTHVDDRLGVSITGMTADEALFGAAAGAIQRQYEDAVAERRPILCTHSMIVAGARHVEYERLVVPLLSEDAAEVVSLVGVVNFTRAYEVARRPLPSAKPRPALPPGV